MSRAFAPSGRLAGRVSVALALVSIMSPVLADGLGADNTEARNFEGLWWPHQEDSSQLPPPQTAVSAAGAPPPADAPGQAPPPGAPSVEFQVRVIECKPVQQMVISGGGLAALVFQSSSEIVMVSEFGMDFSRTIYLNGTHPKGLTPQPNGHSIGRWDGNTLVVDSVGFSDKDGKDRALHTVERITKVTGGFVDDIDINENGAPPKHQVVRYDLRPDEPFNEYVCEESFDRYQFIHGQLDNPNLPPRRNHSD